MRTFKLLFRVRDPKIMHRFQVWAESVHGVYCFVWKKSYLTHTLFTHACGWTVLLTRCGVMLTLNADYLYILKNFVTFNTTFLPSNELKQKRIITHLLVKRLIFTEKKSSRKQTKVYIFSTRVIRVSYESICDIRCHYLLWLNVRNIKTS